MGAVPVAPNSGAAFTSAPAAISWAGAAWALPPGSCIHRHNTAHSSAAFSLTQRLPGQPHLSWHLPLLSFHPSRRRCSLCHPALASASPWCWLAGLVSLAACPRRPRRPSHQSTPAPPTPAAMPLSATTPPTARSGTAQRSAAEDSLAPLLGRYLPHPSLPTLCLLLPGGPLGYCTACSSTAQLCAAHTTCAAHHPQRLTGLDAMLLSS